MPASAPVPPKVRAVTGWIMTRPDRLADANRASLEAILASSTELAAVTAAAVRAFAVIMNDQRGRQLQQMDGRCHSHRGTRPAVLRHRSAGERE
jgi:hypothetical protein